MIELDPDQLRASREAYEMIHSDNSVSYIKLFLLSQYSTGKLQV